MVNKTHTSNSDTMEEYTKLQPKQMPVEKLTLMKDSLSRKFRTMLPEESL
jgi:hypothetical protein